jgi:hypothetical protein
MTASMELIITLLTPFLIAGGLTDPALARQTAQETIAAYKVAAPDQLLSVAQIVTFALAAIDNLRLSLPETLSLSMKLKLRGNANALNRAAQKAAAALEAQRRDAPAMLPAPEVKKPQTPAGASTPAATQSQDLAWAAAMTNVAGEFTAELANLPPIQRPIQLARIGALSDTARTLGSGKAPPLKARLLGSTAMQHQR